jgi:subfamily B ATP-binding cassette protein MsbA
MSSTGPQSSPEVLTPAQIKKRANKKKNLNDFYRALTTFLLGPYKGLVALSAVSAFFVGLAMAGGLGTMLPVLRVLVSGDTIPNWANRTIAESRLGATFIPDAPSLTVQKVKDSGAAKAAGIAPGAVLAPAGGADQAVILEHLSDPAVSTAKVGATTIALPPGPWYASIVRGTLSKFPTRPVPAISCVLLVILLISLFGQSIRYVQEYYSDEAAILAINDIRRRLYDRILHLHVSFFGKAGTSDVTSRLVQDCQGLQDGFKNVLGQSLQMPINALLALIVACSISWKLTLFICLFAPVMFGIIQKFGKKMRRASRRAMQSSSSMLGQIEATLTGIRVVKGSNAERFERRRYTRIMDGLTREQLRMSRIDAVSSPVMELLTFVVVAVVVIWATYLVRESRELSAEKFFVVMACLATIAESGRKIGKMFTSIQKSGASATRIFETLDQEVERPRHMIGRGDRPKISLSPLTREITFQDVSFTYPGAGAPALSGVDLTVKKGESVAIVGRNGSGKTTLLALLPRLFDPGSGRIAIDGIDIRDVTLKSLRDQVSVVTQDSVIFPISIAENIAYGHPLAGRLKEKTPAVLALRARIEAAAKQAFAHEFILEKPNGYDTDLTGLGGGMSGGQKQRLNIARAILRGTPILILDEATSQVDAESEHLIQKAIESLMHERTMFVIAHRLGTIQTADRIIVMDRGRVVAAGQHEELLRSSEAYNQLYERQLFRRPEEVAVA